MAVTSYYSVGGEILGEATGGIRRDYLTDALGSVTGTVTTTGVIENTYRYKPYGAQLSKTGTASDPHFLWLGTVGYQHLGKPYSEKYVRARHLASNIGRWTTEDLIGYTKEYPYGYSYNNPATNLDPSGLKPCMPKKCCCEPKVKQVYKAIQASQPQYVGHYLTTTVSMTRKESYIEGDCKILWEEKTTLRYLAGQPEKKWFDVCDIRSSSCPTDELWEVMPRGCPEGPIVYTDRDVPALDKSNQRTDERMLCIKVTVTDGCTRKPLRLTFNQYLKLDRGRLTSIVPPGKSRRLEEFCNQ